MQTLFAFVKAWTQDELAERIGVSRGTVWRWEDGRGLPLVLAERGASPGAVLARDIRRYYEALGIALREVRLSPGEWNFLRDILNGTLVDSTLIRFLHADVEDAEPAQAEAHGVDQADLAGRIRVLSDFQRLAVVDAVERWWFAQRGE